MTDNDSANINCKNGTLKDIIMGHVKRVELFEIWIWSYAFKYWTN